MLDAPPPAYADLALPPQPPGTLTRPIHRPDVLVPVIELFLA